MTRWITGIFVAVCGFAPTLGLAQGPWEAPGVQQAGFHAGLGQDPVHPSQWHQPSADQTIYELVPDHRLLSGDGSRMPLPVSETLSRSWIRLDYILWEIADTGHQLIGAPTVTDFDLTGTGTGLIPDRPFLPAVDRVNGLRTTPNPTFGIVSRLSQLNPQDLNGLRSSFGIPTRLGTLEGEGFFLEEASQAISVDPFIDTLLTTSTRIGAITLLDNGAVSDTTMLLFSEGFRSSLSTKFAGAEGNWISKPVNPNRGLEISPIIGFRYLRLEDAFRISGQDIPNPLGDPVTGEVTILNHRITSDSENHVFGPQIGVKAVARHWRFTFGLEGKFLFGINRLKDRVTTRELFLQELLATGDLGELPTSTSDENTRFAPVFDLSLYTRFQFTDDFSIFAGYDLVVGAGFSRAFDNVIYDTAPSVTDPPLVRLDNNLQSFYAHGLTVGGELILW